MSSPASLLFSNSSIRRYIMQKAISKYWPVFVLPTLVAFIIGFIWPFIWGTYCLLYTSDAADE